MTKQTEPACLFRESPVLLKRAIHLYSQNRSEFVRVFRYLMCGAWNTLFGFAVYAGAYAWLGRTVNYLFLLIPVNILAITNAFLCYKFFVFKTRGDGWKEYFRCYLVYGWIMILNAVLLYILVGWFDLHPVLGNGVCIVITTVISYLSHKRFSFRIR
jgi:putative flippase GtrA